VRAPEASVNSQTRSAGATPKFRKSDSESSCAPISLVALRRRASSPSSPSIAAAKRIRITAKWKLPVKTKRIAVSPAHRPSSVTMFGTSERKGRVSPSSSISSLLGWRAI